MSKTATVRARIEPDLKSDVEELLFQMGISTTEAINMFFSQVRLRKGMPFPIEIPNSTTVNTFEKTDRGDEVNSYGDLDEMFEALDKC